MGQGLKISMWRLVAVAMVLSFNAADATTLGFEGWHYWGNWAYYELSRPMCTGACIEAMEQDTGLDLRPEDSFYGYVWGDGTVTFMANAETNQLLTSEFRIGDWTDTISSVNFNGGSFYGCFGARSVIFNLSLGGWFYVCKPYGNELQTFQELWDLGQFGAGDIAIGNLVGNGWQVLPKDVSIYSRSVPAPGTLALLSLGLLGLGLTARRRLH